MCTNNYSNKERFDKVTAKIKWCSFFASQSLVALGSVCFNALPIALPVDGILPT